VAVDRRNLNPDCIVDKTFVDEKVVAVGWNQILILVDCKVNYSPHISGGGSHRGAKELEEKLSPHSKMLCCMTSAIASL